MLYGWEDNCRPGEKYWQSTARFVINMSCGLSIYRPESAPIPMANIQAHDHFALKHYSIIIINRDAPIIGW